MDTSKQYILMCEKAEEIQAIRQSDDAVDRNEWWKPGDFIYDKDEYIFNVCGVRHCPFDTGYFDTDDIIWLPRQDQLQEIYAKTLTCSMPTLLVMDFRLWFGKTPVIKFTSMEQLWLAFVMSERYSKQWSGKDWVPNG